MATSTIVFSCYHLTITYHDYDDECQPGYLDGDYYTHRWITFGCNTDLNDRVLDFV